MPSLVREMGVGGHAINFYAHFLELFITVSKIAEFGRADKCKGSREENDDRPFTFELFIGDLYEFAVVKRHCFKGNNLSVD